MTEDSIRLRRRATKPTGICMTIELRVGPKDVQRNGITIDTRRCRRKQMNGSKLNYRPLCDYYREDVWDNIALSE